MFKLTITLFVLLLAIGCKEKDKKLTSPKDPNIAEQSEGDPQADNQNHSSTESTAPKMEDSFTEEEVKSQSEELQESDFENIVDKLKEHWEGKRLKFGLVDFPDGENMCLQFSTEQDQCLFRRSLGQESDISTGACTIEYGDPWDFGTLQLSFEQNDGLIITLTPNVLLKGNEDGFFYNKKRGIMEIVPPEACPVDA